IFFDLDASGKNLIVGTNKLPAGQPFLISVDDGKSRPLANKIPIRGKNSFSFSPDGKFAAGVAFRAEQPTEFMGIEIWNLQSGEEKGVEPSRGLGSFVVKYAPDGTLFSGDTLGNLHHWNLKDSSHQIWKIGNGIVTSAAIAKDGRYVAAIAASTQKWEELPTAK